jgi:small subunit ribosomal protein S27e
LRLNFFNNLQSIKMDGTEKSKFVKVECRNCGNSQVIFSKAATHVKCLVCDSALLNSKGSKAEILAEVQREFE